jgi:UDP-N-acetylglucosamine acyltransferase
VATIHPLALVSTQAELGQNVEIGPFCIVEAGAVIGDHCRLAAQVVVKSGTRLGKHNTVAEGSILGGLPQHAHMPEQIGGLEIGSGNTIREFCTLHRALHEGTNTLVGDHNFFMAGTHVGHDSRVGNHTIIANNALLGGHVTVEDRAFVSGCVAIHQFCRIGRLAMVGGHARVVQDVPPFMTVDGVSGYIVGLNLVGLRRNGYASDEIVQLKEAYRVIYRRGLKWSDVLATLKTEFTSGPAAEYGQFLSAGSRGFVQERRMPPTATLKVRSLATDAEEANASNRKVG